MPNIVSSSVPAVVCREAAAAVSRLHDDALGLVDDILRHGGAYADHEAGIFGDGFASYMAAFSGVTGRSLLKIYLKRTC